MIARHGRDVSKNEIDSGQTLLVIGQTLEVDRDVISFEFDVAAVERKRVRFEVHRGVEQESVSFAQREVDDVPIEVGRRKAALMRHFGEVEDQAVAFKVDPDFRRWASSARTLPWNRRNTR
jgi:hypothetical protein